ncbi:butyrophilin-like protein 2 [Monodelphis domestica]|uniref:butyrophilin-like protein 2 n=1 Tax=Monodelphis domestica TaxID=13616 RepID=UPI0024E25D4C|nr:butyrophilin-like protein 2 [Monodelphis domestica]
MSLSCLHLQMKGALEDIWLKFLTLETCSSHSVTFNLPKPFDSPGPNSQCLDGEIECPTRTFFVVGSQQIIQTQQGDDIILSCRLYPNMDARKMAIAWYQGQIPVHSYSIENGVKEIEGPQFQGRTELLKDEMAEGKVTLKIHQAQASDNGIYTCRFQAPDCNNWAYSVLPVTECLRRKFFVIGSQQIIQTQQGEDIMLSCQLSPNMDARKMTVEWYRGQTLVHSYSKGVKDSKEIEGPQFQGRTELLKDGMAEGKVTLKIHQAQASDNGIYTCRFQAPDCFHWAYSVLPVTECFRSTFSVTGSQQIIQTKQGENIILSCQLSSNMDARKMTIAWFQGQTLVHNYSIENGVKEIEGPQFQGRTELLKDDMAEGKVTLKIHQAQASDNGIYTCRFRSPDCFNWAYSVLAVAVSPTLPRLCLGTLGMFGNTGNIA